MHFKKLLINPDGWFESHRSINLWQPAVIVLLVGVINSIPGFMIANAMEFESQQGITESFLMAGQIVGVFFGIILMFTGWLVYAGIMHILSDFIERTDGEFRKTFYYVGWGYVPSVFSSLVSAAATWYTLNQLAVNDLPAEEFTSIVNSQPMMEVSLVLDFVFLLWGSMIWIFAVKHARNVTLRTATIAATIPVLFRISVVASNVVL